VSGKKILCAGNGINTFEISRILKVSLLPSAEELK
jgi:hypothetical protein